MLRSQYQEIVAVSFHVARTWHGSSFRANPSNRDILYYTVAHKIEVVMIAAQKAAKKSDSHNSSAHSNCVDAHIEYFPDSKQEYG